MDFINQLFENMNLMGVGIAVLVTIPILIVAGVFLFMVLRAGGKVRASRSWLSTPGRVLTSYIEPRRSHSSRGGTTTAYYAVVLYEYAVNGQRLRGNRIRFGADIGYGWTAKAQETVNQYPEGALVEVFYNPDQPAEAVLQRSASGSNRMFLFIALIIVASVLCTLAMTFGAFGLTQNFLQGLGIGQMLDAAQGAQGK